MVGSAPVRILWLDDELIAERKAYVSPWIDWFERDGRHLGAETRAVATLKEWVAELNAPGLKFDLLVLDVMLKREPEKDFGLLGYPDEKILRLDAGAQIAGLLRNKNFKNGRQDWLATYSTVPVVLLSSTTMVGELAKQYVDDDKSDGVSGVTKDIVVVDGLTRVSSEFASAMQRKIEQLARSKERRS